MAHYIGNDIPLSFVALEEGRALSPRGATITFYNPRGKNLKEDKAKVDRNEVSYLIPGKLIAETGKYLAVFDVKLPTRGETTHIVDVIVDPLPIGDEIDEGQVIDIGVNNQPKRESWEDIFEEMLWKQQKK